MILFASVILYVITFLLGLLFNIRPPSNLAFCGLMGFVGRRPVDITKWKWLFIENESRGKDSVGAYGGGKRFRAVGPPKANLNDPELFKVLRGSHIVIGHTRAGTMGHSTIANAHPFRIDNGDKYYVGAHNGFLLDEIYNLETLNKVGIEEMPPVDSLAIFKALANANGDFNVLKHLEGAMALSVVIGDLKDKSSEKLYLYRRPSRPLFIGEANDGLYYSSLKPSLEYIGCKEIYELPTDTLFVFKDGVLIDTQPVEKPSITLSLNTGRHGWKTGLKYEEYKHLIKEPTTKTSKFDTSTDDEYEDYYGLGGHFPISNHNSQQRRIGFRQNNINNNSTSTLKDKLNILVSDINEMANFYNKELPVKASDSEEYEKDDQSSGLIVITLKGETNTKSKDTSNLQAWAVYDSEKPTINGFTGPMGTTVLKFPQELCDTERKIKISHPLEPQVPTYTLNFKPRGGRIMEVVLNIPFREKDYTKQEHKSETGGRCGETSSGGGSDESSLFSARDGERGCSNGTVGDVKSKLSISPAVHPEIKTRKDTALASRIPSIIEGLIADHYHVNFYPGLNRLNRARENWFYQLTQTDLEDCELAKEGKIDVKVIMDHAVRLRIAAEEEHPTLLFNYSTVINVMLNKIGFYYFNTTTSTPITASDRSKDINTIKQVLHCSNTEGEEPFKKKLTFIT